MSQQADASTRTDQRRTGTSTGTAAAAQAIRQAAGSQPAPHFVVHNDTDTVGVVVVEGVTQGQDLSGWVMNTDATITVTAQADIPLGHKVAIRPIKSGDAVLKYDHDIGRAVEDIPAGGYVHYHNVKTKRW